MKNSSKIRYAVIGMGHIAQNAVLPAFAHAGKNSELAAVLSEDPVKRSKVAKKYGVPSYSYKDFEHCLSEQQIDAVYIALPNSMHCEFAVRAANKGMHILCEKPLAVTEAECREMIRAAEKNKVKLMTAYRLHFEESSLKAALPGIARRIGDPRFFDSAFSMQVPRDNIRVKESMGGGTLYDIGIYCINAARAIFRAEPSEVVAMTSGKKGNPGNTVEEMTGAVLKFPKDRLAVFVTSFGASDVSYYRIGGTKGDLRVEPAYEYAEPLRHHLTKKGKTSSTSFPKRDQFAPEILYFSDCILHGRSPEPSGREGLTDVRIIEAIYRSAKTGKAVKLDLPPDRKYPSLGQEIRRPALAKPRLVHVKAPHQ